jgi:hypothetical protein
MPRLKCYFETLEAIPANRADGYLTSGPSNEKPAKCLFEPAWMITSALTACR